MILCNEVILDISNDTHIQLTDTGYNFHHSSWLWIVYLVGDGEVITRGEKYM